MQQPIHRDQQVTHYPKTRPFTQQERAAINVMLGQLLIDSALRREFIEQRSIGLMDTFNIPEHIQQWLCRLPATSLEEIAQAVAYHP